MIGGIRVRSLLFVLIFTISVIYNLVELLESDKIYSDGVNVKVASRKNTTFRYLPIYLNDYVRH